MIVEGSLKMSGSHSPENKIGFIVCLLKDVSFGLVVKTFHDDVPGGLVDDFLTKAL